MPLRKYRSVEEMRPVVRLKRLDADNLRVACDLSELSYALHSWRFVPGVRKFRTVAAASRRRAEWERSQVRKPLEKRCEARQE